jgi:hypothetical protein
VKPRFNPQPNQIENPKGHHMAVYCEICQQQFDSEADKCRCAVLRVELKEDEAQSLALFLKRLLLDDFAAKCAPHDTRPTATREAMQYTMQRGANKILAALAQAGADTR